MVGLTFVQRPLGILKRVRVVSVGDPCCRRWATQHCNASFGHKRGSPVAPCPIFSPRTPFFCVMNTSITDTAAESSLSVAVEVSNTVHPTLNVTSDRRKGALSYFVPVYSLSRSSKKKAIMIISVMACSSGSLEAADTQSNRSSTCTGMCLTREVGGS